MDTDSFIVYIKTDDTYKEIAEDVKATFYTSNYGLERLLPKGKNSLAEKINFRKVIFSNHLSAIAKKS